MEQLITRNPYNVSMEVADHFHVIRIDMRKERLFSKTGKSRIIATTRSWVDVTPPDAEKAGKRYSLNLNFIPEKGGLVRVDRTQYPFLFIRRKK